MTDRAARALESRRDPEVLILDWRAQARSMKENDLKFPDRFALDQCADALEEALRPDPRWYTDPGDGPRFHCLFKFLGWWHWSVGIHVDLWHPHMMVHLPFGFVSIGWDRWGSHLRQQPRDFGWTRR